MLWQNVDTVRMNEEKNKLNLSRHCKETVHINNNTQENRKAAFYWASCWVVETHPQNQALAGLFSFYKGEILCIFHLHLPENE